MLYYQINNDVTLVYMITEEHLSCVYQLCSALVSRINYENL